MNSANVKDTAAPERMALGHTLRLVGRMFLLLRPHWGRLGRGIGLGFVGGAFSLVLPLVTKMLFDDAYPSRDASLALVLLIGTAALSMASTMMAALRSLFGQLVGARLTTEVNLYFNRHLLQLPTSFFDKRRVGEITSRSGDLQRAVAFVTTTLQTTVLNGLHVLLVPPILLWLEWRLALLSLLGLPFTTAVSLVAGRWQRSYARQQFDRGAEASGFFFEAIGNIRTIKAARAEQYIAEGVRARAVSVQQSVRHSALLGVAVSMLNGSIKVLSGLALGIVSWTFLLNDSLSLGAFVAFNAYLGYLTGPITQFAGLFVRLQQAAVSLERLFEYLDEPIESVLAPELANRPIVFAPSRALITFDRVSFSYGGERDLLSSASFEIGHGISAFVGASGSGKSSLVRLLLRFYQPSGGRILLSGADAAMLPIQQVRGAFSTVFQEHGLLRGTVRENLTLGFSRASESEIADVLSVVQMDEFIRQLPLGLETLVAEAGTSMSAGQRQRLSVARALLRPSQILILDEATSALDASTERAMIDRIVDSYRGTAILMISHRLNTIRHLTQVFVVGGGKVTGGGTFDELLAESESFRQLIEAGTYGSVANAIPLVQVPGER